jgi:hypothetical protein
VSFDPGVREDDNPPQDDPAGNINRVFNHFYDPYLNSGLLDGWGSKAPDWAINGTDNIGARRNHFSIKHAKEAMFRAATLRMLVDGRLEKVPTPVYGLWMTQEEQRAAYWATVFRALGDTEHLLQDMAQPQHRCS